MLGRIKDSIDKGIVSMSVKSSTYLETEKLKTKVENTTGKIKAASMEMGAAVYEQWKVGAVKMDYIETMCGHMKEMENEIAGYQAQIDKLEQEKAKILGEEENSKAGGCICTCGYRSEPGANFCVHCGKPLPEPGKSSEQKKCPVCGMDAESDARFCIGCGNPFVQET